jgi:hypothetical protein
LIVDLRVNDVLDLTGYCRGDKLEGVLDTTTGGKISSDSFFGIVLGKSTWSDLIGLI